MKNPVAHQLLAGLALLSTGLLAGTFVYGAVNLVAAFNDVPLQTRLTFHTSLMRMNGIVVQTFMGTAIISAILLCIFSRGADRYLALAASVLASAALLITRFGNVPINRKIREWSTGAIPSNHATILERWEMFNNMRTAAGVLAFICVIAIVLLRQKA
ncbi:MAG: DUF1772 domain-containing protein [Corynebacteriales bacterium]|nr:DUF1772 domain-containing protein [Mycobacteriales bacterium]